MRPLRVKDAAEVVYSEEHWRVLRVLRLRALAVMEALEQFGLRCYAIGSVARGDVHAGSDVDIVVEYPVAPFMVENALKQSGFEIYKKELVQATPAHAVKLNIYLDEKTSVSLHLTRPSPREQEFYVYCGHVSPEELRRDIRKPGVNKRLLYIEPTPRGHVEFSVIGREEEVASLLGVSVDIVRERIEMLTRRAEEGRTGLFLRVELHPHESIETALKSLARANPVLRKKLTESGVI